MLSPDQYHTKSNDAEERAVSALRELLREARSKKITGRRALSLEFHQGGVTSIRKTAEEQI